jgi:hypothetical protein
MQDQPDKMSNKARDGANQQPGADASTKVVVVGADNCINNNCGNDRRAYGERAIDFKATKRMFCKHGIKSKELEALSILWLYLEFNTKFEVGCTLKDVGSWSGYGDYWLKKLTYHISQLIDKGCVEKIPFNVGFRYLITGKGFAILRTWERERQMLWDDVEKRRITARLKAETTKLNRSKRKRENGKFVKI